MAWRMTEQWLKNCSFDAGCPCDFNRAPTNHVCEGMVGLHIVEGHYDEIPLSRLTWAMT